MSRGTDADIHKLMQVCAIALGQVAHPYLSIETARGLCAMILGSFTLSGEDREALRVAKEKLHALYTVLGNWQNDQLRQSVVAIEKLLEAPNGTNVFQLGRMKTALQELRNRALASTSEFSAATAASIAHICEEALEGV